MKKIINWLLILAVVCSAVLFTPTEVKAEDLTVSGIPDIVAIGDTFTVKVDVPDNIGGVLYVSYAKDNLKFKTGKGGLMGVFGDNGLLNCNVSFGSPEVEVTFEATSVGDVEFSVYLDEAEYSDTVDKFPTVPKITKKIKVVNEIYSDDNTLSTMYLSQGYISPDFNPNTTTYRTTVEYGVTSVRVTAKPNHAKATIASVTGNENLQVGENTISVVVKAESGATRTYKIIVTRLEKTSETPSDTGATENPGNTENKIEGTDSGFDWSGKDLYFTEAAPESSLIKDFKQETVLIDSLNVPCYKFQKANLVLLNLKNDVDNGTLYVYHPNGGYIYPYIKLEANDVYIIALQPDETVEAPEGYSACTLSIEGKGTVTAYQYQARTASEFYLLYCVNNNGQYGWYQYDTVEGTFQRYSGAAPQITTPGGDTEDTQNSEHDVQANTSNSELAAQLKAEKEKNVILICVFVFVVAVLLVVIFNLILLRRKTDSELEEELSAEELELLEEEISAEADKIVEEIAENEVLSVSETNAEADDEIEIEFYEMAEEMPVEETAEVTEEIEQIKPEPKNVVKKDTAADDGDEDFEFIDL